MTADTKDMWAAAMNMSKSSSNFCQFSAMLPSKINGSGRRNPSAIMSPFYPLSLLKVFTSDTV